MTLPEDTDDATAGRFPSSTVINCHHQRRLSTYQYILSVHDLFQLMTLVSPPSPLIGDGSQLVSRISSNSSFYLKRLHGPIDAGSLFLFVCFEAVGSNMRVLCLDSMDFETEESIQTCVFQTFVIPT